MLHRLAAAQGRQHLSDEAQVRGGWNRKKRLEHTADVDAALAGVDRRRQCRGITEICLDRPNVDTMRDVFGQWRAMVHQPQLMSGRHELTRETATQVARGASDQNRASVWHVIQYGRNSS